MSENGSGPTSMKMTSEPANPEIEALLERIKTANERTALDGSNIKQVAMKLHDDALALVAEYERLREKFDRVEAIVIDQQFQIDDFIDRLENIADFADIWVHEEAEEDDEPTV